MKKTARIVSMFLTKDPGHGRVRSRLFILPFTVLLLFSSQSFSFAGSATWQLNPTTGDWNTAGNWSPMTVPNGSGDIATFATSNQTDVSISADTEVNRIVFPPGADAFTISVLPLGSRGDYGNILTLSGSGISNDSGRDQHFVINGDVLSGFPAIGFTGQATAGNQTIFTFIA